MALDGIGVARDRRCRQCPNQFSGSVNVNPAHPVLGAIRPCPRWCAASGTNPANWPVINPAFLEGTAANCTAGYWAALTPVDLVALAAAVQKAAVARVVAQLAAILGVSRTAAQQLAALEGMVTANLLEPGLAAEVAAQLGIILPPTTTGA